MRLAVVGTLALALAAASAASAAPTIPRQGVVLQALDKVTARVSPLEVRIDEIGRFGNLAIAVRACFDTPPTAAPESAAFLEVREIAASGAERVVFSGWMFASSPGLSAMDHPVYDLWLVACTAPPEPDEPETPSTTQTPNG